jgi:hypothetical protein
MFISDDMAIVEMIKNMKALLDNCQATLSELTAKLQKGLTPIYKGKGSRMP